MSGSYRVYHLGFRISSVGEGSRHRIQSLGLSMQDSGLGIFNLVLKI